MERTIRCRSFKVIFWSPNVGWRSPKAFLKGYVNSPSQRGTFPELPGSHEFLIRVVKPFEDRNRFGWTGTTTGRLRSLSPALWWWRRRHVWRQVGRSMVFEKETNRFKSYFAGLTTKTVSISPLEIQQFGIPKFDHPTLRKSIVFQASFFSKKLSCEPSRVDYPYRGSMSASRHENPKTWTKPVLPKACKRNGSFESILVLNTTPRPNKRWWPLFFFSKLVIVLFLKRICEHNSWIFDSLGHFHNEISYLNGENLHQDFFAYLYNLGDFCLIVRFLSEPTQKRLKGSAPTISKDYNSTYRGYKL